MKQTNFQTNQNIQPNITKQRSKHKKLPEFEKEKVMMTFFSILIYSGLVAGLQILRTIGGFITVNLYEGSLNFYWNEYKFEAHSGESFSLTYDKINTVVEGQNHIIWDILSISGPIWIFLVVISSTMFLIQAYKLYTDKVTSIENNYLKIGLYIGMANSLVEFVLFSIAAFTITNSFFGINVFYIMCLFIGLIALYFTYSQLNYFKE